MDILFIFTRGPHAGSKILIENADNITHAMDLVREEIPVSVIKSDARNNSSVLTDVFDSHDWEVMHVRRRIDADPEGVAVQNYLSVK